MNAAADGATQLFLVRHGATDANLRRPYILQGDGIDLPLNETGRRQAEGAASFLANFPVRHVYASPLLRAMQTATRIAQQHGVDVSAAPELRECNVGKWEGLDWETIRRDYTDAFHAFDRNPGEVPYLGGESYGDVLRRARPALEALLHRHAGEVIVVVAHNVVNRVLVAGMLGLELHRARELQQGNGCVNLIRSHQGKMSLITMNAMFHLEESLRT